MKTLVTGASGHVGANLVRALLAEGREVVALVHKDKRALEGLDIQCVYGDICDPDGLEKACQGVEVVYHLAALISITGGQDGLVEAVNVTGTKNLVQACQRQQVRRLIHFSSIHAIQQVPLDEPLDEERPLASDPKTLAYDLAKAAGEKVAIEGATDELDVVVVNPVGIIGPLDYRKSQTGVLLDKLYRGKMPALVAGGFDWVDVRDVVTGAMQAEKHGKSGHRYLLPGTWASLTELAELVHKAGGKPPPRLVAPLWLAAIGTPFVQWWSTILGSYPLYTRDSLYVLRHSNTQVSRKKAQADLGYQTRPLQETVLDTITWWQEAQS